jgi:hypothetical protein
MLMRSGASSNFHGGLRVASFCLLLLILSFPVLAVERADDTFLAGYSRPIESYQGISSPPLQVEGVPECPSRLSREVMK